MEQSSFNLTSQNTDAFCSTPGLNGLLQQVLNLVQFGDGIPLVVAGKGGGKTAFASELHKSLDTGSFVNLVDAKNYQDEFAGLLQHVALTFGVVRDDTQLLHAGDYLSQLRQFSQAIAAESRVAIVMVDNAQILGDMALASLLSLMHDQIGKGSGLRLVLIGEQSLVEQVDAIGMHDLAVYDLSIPAFSPSELRQLLSIKEPMAASALDDASINHIWNQAKGDVNRALALFRSSLSDPSSAIEALNDRSASKTKPLPVIHIVSVSVLLAVLFWVLVVYSPNEAELLKENTLPPIVINDRGGKSIAGSDAHSVQSQVIENSGLNENLSAAKQPTLQEVSPRVSIDEKASLVGSDSGRLSNATSGSGAPAQDKNADALAGDTAAVAEKFTSPTSKANSESESPLSTADQSPLGKLLVKSKQSILRQPDSAYTLQVLALSNEAAVVDYVNQQFNKRTLMVYRARRGSKDLYMVLSGVYASSEKAKKAVLDLPLKQRQAKPWSRTFESIKADMTYR